MVSLSVKTSKCFRDNGKWLQQLSVFVSDVSNLLLVLGLADLSPQEQELLRKIRKKKNEVLDEIKVLYINVLLNTWFILYCMYSYVIVRQL